MLLTRRNLPLNALRAFEAAAEHCHLRKAAADLGVSHGAISRQVRLLEQQLGVRLFDRSHNKLALTSAGLRLLEGVSASFDELTQAALYLNPQSMAGPLVVASTPSITVTWLVSIVGRFSQRYPEVEIRMVNIEPLQQQLPADVDVAICYGQAEPDGRELSALFTDQYFPVCNPRLLTQRNAVIKVSDLLAYPLLHDRHQHWPRWLAQYLPEHKQTPRGIYLSEAHQVLSAVREGFGIGLVDKTEVYQDLREGRLRALSEHKIAAQHQHYLLTDKPDKQTIRAQVFTEFLQQQLQVLLAH